MYPIPGKPSAERNFRCVVEEYKGFPSENYPRSVKFEVFWIIMCMPKNITHLVW